MVYFSEEVLNKFSLESYKEKLMHASEVTHLDDQYIVLLDLPKGTDELRELFKVGFPAQFIRYFIKRITTYLVQFRRENTLNGTILS